MTLRLRNYTTILLLLLITALYAYLMFKDTIPAWSLVLLAVLFLLYLFINRPIMDKSPETGAITNHPSRRDTTCSSAGFKRTLPLALPVLILLFLLPVSFLISTDKTLSLPKIYALLLSIAFFFLILAAVRTKKMLLLALIAVLLLALGTSLLGLVAADWSDISLPVLSSIINRIPRLWNIFPNLLSGPVVNVNTIGGALTFFIPLLVSLILDGGAFKRFFFLKKSNRYTLQTFYKIFLIALLLLVLFVLILTRSRGAWLGSAIGLYLLMVLKNRRFLWLLPVFILIFLFFFFVIADGSFSTLITLLDTDPEVQTLQGRLQAWRATLYMIQDFPITGAGIGTYSHVFNDLYALNTFLTERTPDLHAHNTFLSVAVDLGIPALVLYLALLGGFAAMLVRTYHGARSFIKTLLLGLGCGMLAHQVFGLTDAFVLGTKLGIIFWIYLALTSALYVNFNPHFEPAPSPDSTGNQSIKGFFLGLGTWDFTSFLSLVTWILVFLLCLSLINLNIYLSLSLAILGGFIIGILQVKRINQDFLTANDYA